MKACVLLTAYIGIIALINEWLYRRTPRPRVRRPFTPIPVPPLPVISPEKYGVIALKSAFESSGPRPGDILFHRYRITTKVADGSVNPVWHAIDAKSGDDLIVKFVEGSKENLANFSRQEAAILKALDGRHAPVLVEAGSVGKAGCILVMRNCQARSMRSYINRGDIDWRDRIDAALATATALAHLEQEYGLLHRDIKPENILLYEYGADNNWHATIIDFGLCHLPGFRTGERPDQYVATPAYCSPEVVKLGGPRPKHDQFSLGATVYELITGCRLIPGEDAVDISCAIARAEYSVCEHEALDEDIRLIIERAVAYKPEDRFPSVLAFAKALVPHARPKTRARCKKELEALEKSLYLPL